MKQNYENFYERITDKITERQKYIIRVLNKITTYFYYLAYPVLLIYLWIFQRSSFIKELLIPGCSFLILSLIRKKINRKRPYESYSIHPIIYKNTKGCSMPSRHVFSASLISMCYFYVFPSAGLLMMALTVFAGVIRVVGGVHYPGDVIAGFICGIVSGLFIFIS